jgi:tetratricopeptide (TPR) repeat protein
MKIIPIIISVFLLLNTTPAAQDSTAHKLALKGIDLGTNLHYKESYEVFEQLIKLEPDNPRGYFLRSAIYFWMFSEDIKNEEIGNKFRDLSYEAVEIAEARLEENENDIDARFYLGGAYGSLGRYYAMTKSYLNAYWYGKKGKNYLEEVVEMDSTYYDAYLGLGIYHYLADVLPRFIKILSFVLGVEGDKEKGIREIELAAEKGVYTKTEAMFFLGAIYTYRERKYEKAIHIFNELLENYPHNPGVLLSLGRCYSRMGQCDKALSAFTKVLDNKESQSRLPRGSIYYQLGEVYFDMNDIPRAKNNYLLAIASDSAEVGKKRWITPRSHLKVATCYEILGEIESAKYHLGLINEDDNERAYEEAQERLEKPLTELDISLLKARNLRECNQFDLALNAYQLIKEKYAQSTDPKIQNKLKQIDYRVAEIYFERNEYEKAIILFEQIIATSEDQDEWIVDWSYFYLGNCYKNLEDYESAMEAYDAAENTDDDWLLGKIEDEREDLPSK